ncbi:unnamed protein product, partial [Effrenium voratum]
MESPYSGAVKKPEGFEETCCRCVLQHFRMSARRRHGGSAAAAGHSAPLPADRRRQCCCSARRSSPCLAGLPKRRETIPQRVCLQDLILNGGLADTVKKIISLQVWEYSAVCVPYHDNGLFANVLQVADVLLLAKPGVPVLVDWRRKGSEGHFQYGPENFDLWSHLFEPGERCRSLESVRPDALSMPGRINCLFMNMLRGYLWCLPQDDLAQLRAHYSAVVSEIAPRPHIKRRLEEICGHWEDCYVVGVHKRLACSEMVACQLSQRAPSNEEYVARARKLFAASKGRKVLFLATDDSQAVRAFEAAFSDGVELCCRSGVKRSSGGVREDGVDNE